MQERSEDDGRITVVLLESQIAVAINAQLFNKTKLKVIRANPIAPGSFRFVNFLDFPGNRVCSYLLHDMCMPKKVLR